MPGVEQCGAYFSSRSQIEQSSPHSKQRGFCSAKPCRETVSSEGAALSRRRPGPRRPPPRARRRGQTRQRQAWRGFDNASCATIPLVEALGNAPPSLGRSELQRLGLLTPAICPTWRAPPRARRRRWPPARWPSRPPDRAPARSRDIDARFAEQACKTADKTRLVVVGDIDHRRREFGIYFDPLIARIRGLPSWKTVPPTARSWLAVVTESVMKLS